MRTKLLCWLAITALWAWLFGAVLVEGRVLDFRDVAHFYRPLWQWTSSEWTAGRMPLWSPLDGLGMPLHADPTASLFYPGQLLFALPFDFTTRLNLYVALHVLLAAATLYYAARGLGASVVGAAAGAMSYAFGGQVLFQYCNPIYLVSAAWLPLAALATHQMFTHRSLRWAIVLAISLALMVLGGDPQMAYHALLLAALYGWILSKPQATSQAQSVRWHQRRITLLAASGATAFVLAAVQVLPSLQWSAQSERAAFDRPRSLWESGRYVVEVATARRRPVTTVSDDIAIGLSAPPTADTHHEHVYDFSIAPWRWLEFVWPNIGGRMFPSHQRWMSGIPAEGRIWTPTLYLGLAPFLLALSAFSLRRSADATTRWLSWQIVIGMVGSLGAYGLGWLAQELTGGATATKAIGAPVGGLYWFFVVLLPGYVQFRYPAKLMVVASLGLSLLAARHWESTFTARWSRLRAILPGLAALSAMLLAILLFTSARLQEWLATAQEEIDFGKLKAAGATSDILVALGTTLALSLLLLGLCWLGRKRPELASLVALGLLAVDLGLANTWLISSSPGKVLESPQWLATDLRVPSASRTRIYRSSQAVDGPLARGQKRFDDRVEDLFRLDRVTLGGKFYYEADLASIDPEVGVMPLDLRATLDVLRERAALRGAATENDYAQELTLLGVNSALLPLLPAPGGGWEQWDCVPGEVSPAQRRRAQIAGIPEAAWDPSIQVLRTNRSLPRCWLERDVNLVTRQPSTAPYQAREVAEVRVQSTADMLSGGLYLVDVESSTKPPWLASLQKQDRVEGWNQNAQRPEIRISRETSQWIVLESAIDTPRYLVVADYYYAGWHARITDLRTGTTQAAPIFRTNGLFRGIYLPAGEHEIAFFYRPTSLLIGGALSLMAWSALVLWGLLAGLDRLGQWRQALLRPLRAR